MGHVEQMPDNRPYPARSVNAVAVRVLAVR